jgi:hypothetical protein
MPGQGVDDLLAAARPQRAAHQRGQHKAGLVEKNQGGSPAEGVADDARELIIQPPRHLLFVLLAGANLRLVTAPAQALLEHAADVFGVVVNAKVAFDQGGNAVGGPEVVGPTVVLGALQKQTLHLEPLLVGKQGLTTRVGLGS